MPVSTFTWTGDNLIELADLFNSPGTISLARESGEYRGTTYNHLAIQPYTNGPIYRFSPSSDPIEYLICHICGALELLQHSETFRTRCITNNYCFNCDFWTEIIRAANKSSVCIDGHHYQIGAEHGSNPDVRGFGGRRFHIRFFDGRQLTTTNLWYQGKIPSHFRDQLPDNAEFVKEEAHR